MGITNEIPTTQGVAWSLEPDKETMKDWVVIGHCYDCDVAAQNPEVLSASMLFQSSRFSGLPVSYIVLRSEGKGIKLKFRVIQNERGESGLQYAAQRALLSSVDDQESILEAEDIDLDQQALVNATLLL
jgi:hypothetical protein